MSTTRPVPRGKIRELAIYAIGLGVLLALITWLIAKSLPQAGPDGMRLWIPLTIAGSFILSGILTMAWRTKPIIIVTAYVVALGFAVDLYLGFAPLKAVLSCAAALLIINTATTAMCEAEAEAAGSADEKPATKSQQQPSIA